MAQDSFMNEHDKTNLGTVMKDGMQDINWQMLQVQRNAKKLYVNRKSNNLP